MTLARFRKTFDKGLFRSGFQWVRFGEFEGSRAILLAFRLQEHSSLAFSSK
jgi:hypothetical protein